MATWIIGNWKLNPATLQEAKQLAGQLVDKVHQGESHDVRMMVAPSFIHLDTVQAELSKHKDGSTAILLASQDVGAKCADTGAYTGEVSARQLADMGVGSVLVGHSERRQHFGEGDDVLIQKIKHAFAQGLSVIFCVGESHEQYLAKQTFAVIDEQLGILDQFASSVSLPDEHNPNDLPKIFIAYEPIWAIGTGLTPTVDEVEGVHNFISETLSTMELYAPILYGGSVKPDNAKGFAKLALVDGVLVGGASLNADDFLQIAHAFMDD